MSKPYTSPEQSEELQELFAAFVDAVVRAGTVAKAEGMESAAFSIADAKASEARQRYLALKAKLDA